MTTAQDYLESITTSIILIRQYAQTMSEEECLNVLASLDSTLHAIEQETRERSASHAKN